jgi:hypothetical protein
VKHRPPYHLVRTDLPRAQGLGIYYDLGIAACDLDQARRLFPAHKWAIVCEQGIVNVNNVERKLPEPYGISPLLRNDALTPRRFKIVRKAA